MEILSLCSDQKTSKSGYRVRPEEYEVEVIIGSGTLESEMRSILHQVDGVQWQPHHSIHEIYTASDVFKEELPIDIIVAMKAGLHLLYIAVCGVQDISKPKRTSVEEIQRLLTTLIIKADYSLAQDVADSFICFQKFDWNNLASDTIQVYAKLYNDG